MAETVMNTLPAELQEYLQGDRLVLIHTVDYETQSPNVAAISWLLAMDSNTIRFAVDPRSRIVTNLNHDPHISVTVIGPQTVHAVIGKAQVYPEQMEGVSIKMVRVEITVQEVRDVMFYGGKMTGVPTYEKTYDPKLAEKLDREVYTSLQKE